jgi:short-subunit dehydrogenase
VTWSLRDGTALVTGATAGIGAAMVPLLVERGMKVVATGRRGERLEALEKAHPGHVIGIAADLSNPADRERLIAQAVEKFGAITLLVNNAGMGQRGPIELIEEKDARRQMDVNVFSQIELTRAVLPAMRKAGRGRILMVSSVMGRVAVPLSGWYCASKHALEALSDALRYEVAPFGVDVVLIEPGPVITEFQDHAMKTLDHLRGDRAAYDSMMVKVHEGRKSAMKGWITSEDCARQMVDISACASPRSRYPITKLSWALIFARWLLPARMFEMLVRRMLKVPPYGALRPA